MLILVPMIAIFTKFEWRITDEFGKLCREGVKKVVAHKKAPMLAEETFKVKILNRINELPHPPAGYVCLQSKLPQLG